MAFVSERTLTDWVRVQSRKVACVKLWHKDDGTGVLSVKFRDGASYDCIREERGGSTFGDLQEMLNAKSPYTFFREGLTRARGFLVFGPMYE
jgi:hypothetical protein